MDNKFDKIRKDLVILNVLDIKPNYSQLARKYNCDWRTIKKYHNGYHGKPKTRSRTSRLDKHIQIIK